MNPIFLDLHIHTSENPNFLNENYDVDLLLSQVKEVSCQSEFLISLTDHNVLNKSAYLKLIQKTENVLLGVELHIRNYKEKPPYHCHIFFDLDDINEENIDKLNDKLSQLYPDKIISADTENVPILEDIIRTYDSYDFLLLPHGGQSHSTFDTSIPRNVMFDTTLERSIYYNQFDGFTARSNDGLENTIEYFKRLGINGFVNLITCTDNYNPLKYPKAKADEASPFVPTWMFSLPTFNGLRLSLSESSRLVYSKTKPKDWAEYIKRVILKNELIDIEVDLTPGLNVVIGGSSSGKTLFVDSIDRKISENFAESQYNKFDVDQINIFNPSGSKPHYISQNYIIKIVDQNNTENSIDDIDIIRNVFPGEDSVSSQVRNALVELKSDLNKLIKSIKTIEREETELSRIPVFSRLILNEHLQENLIDALLPAQDIKSQIEYDQSLYNQHIKQLESISSFLEKNPFVESPNIEINTIKEKLELAYQMSNFESEIRNIIIKYKEEIDSYLCAESQEQHTKKQNFEKLLTSIRNYSSVYRSLKKHYIKYRNIPYNVKLKKSTLWDTPYI